MVYIAFQWGPIQQTVEGRDFLELDYLSSYSLVRYMIEQGDVESY